MDAYPPKKVNIHVCLIHITCTCTSLIHTQNPFFFTCLHPFLHPPVLRLQTSAKLLHHHLVLWVFTIKMMGHISVIISWFTVTCAPKQTFYSLSLSARQIKIRWQLGVPPLTCIWQAANIIFTAVIITIGSNQAIWLLTVECTSMAAQCLLHLTDTVLKNTVC